MCTCDYEPPKLYEEIERTARKQHRCTECRYPIAVGERYIHISGLWEGGFSHHKYCLSCHAIARTIDCYLIGDMYDELIEVGDIWQDGGVWVSRKIEIVDQEPLKGVLNMNYHWTDEYKMVAEAATNLRPLAGHLMGTTEDHATYLVGSRIGRVVGISPLERLIVESSHGRVEVLPSHIRILLEDHE